MADEEIQEDVQEDAGDIELDEEVQPKVETKSEKRIKELSSKVKLTSQERDEKDKLLKQAQKEVEFYSAFSDATDKYPNAKEYKEQIKEKVLAGYLVEDAAVSVLAKEGKLEAPKTESPAGGSATNLPTTGEPKPLNEMSREEKRAEVLKAIDRGDVSLT